MWIYFILLVWSDRKGEKKMLFVKELMQYHCQTNISTVNYRACGEERREKREREKKIGRERERERQRNIKGSYCNLAHLPTDTLI